MDESRYKMHVFVCITDQRTATKPEVLSNNKDAPRVDVPGSLDSSVVLLPVIENVVRAPGADPGGVGGVRTPQKFQGALFWRAKKVGKKKSFLLKLLNCFFEGKIFSKVAFFSIVSWWGHP